MVIPRSAVRVVVSTGLVVSAGLARGARAQNPPTPVAPPPPAIISGAIVDSAGIPIPHAVLSVVGESLRVVTDSQGRFRLAVPPGPRLLAVRALGYRPLMWAVTLGSGLEASGRIRLQQLSIVLPEMTVVGERYVPSRLAGFYQRRRIGFGKYIDPETIERRFTNSVADLLQGIAGVRVTPVPGDPLNYLVNFSRCNVIEGGSSASSSAGGLNILGGRAQSTSPSSPSSLGPPSKSPVGVYVDGFKVPGYPGEILAMINPADVEAIEVYRGPSELPAEFMSDDCAAIVIWTKY